MPDNTVPRDELRATIDARRELGEEYEPALVESFLDRLETSIAARVKEEVDTRVAKGSSKKDKEGKDDVDPSIPIALGSLGIGIPLTAIAAGNAGFAGLMLAWGGIIAINVAHAISRGRRR